MLLSENATVHIIAFLERRNFRFTPCSGKAAPYGSV